MFSACRRPGSSPYSVTLTFWRDDAAARAFSYNAGIHRHQMDRLRAENLADRTSFTRCHVLHGTGSWPGVPA